MPLQSLFPTLVYSARLPRAASLNTKLLRECMQLERDDESGRRWSVRNYPGGYTSYNSASRMHELSPTFALRRRKLERRRWVVIPATAGNLVLFESWFRHEVPPNPATFKDGGQRVSISFNYNWF